MPTSSSDSDPAHASWAGSSSSPARSLSVQDVFSDDALSSIVMVAGQAGAARYISHPRVQKAGLVLAGHLRGISGTRVQVLGETEISYLDSLEDETGRDRVSKMFALELSAVVVTRGVEPPSVLVAAARDTATPLFVSPHRSSRTIASIHTVLDRLLAVSTSAHGVLVDVHGLGVLLLGPSGIGKSECALVLVERGHRLVADDHVLLHRAVDGRVLGSAPLPLRDHLEVRGLGVLNIRDLFGATSVRLEQAVELVIELFPWTGEPIADRLGLDGRVYEILDAKIPMLKIPVSPGRDMGVILEVAARNELLKRAGEHSARRFVERLSKDNNPPENEGPLQ